MPIGMGAALGALLIFIIIFLEPTGTDRYTASWRHLRLSGYGLCVMLPFVLVHALDRLRYRRNGRRWHVGLEFQSKLLVVVAALLLSYAYNDSVVNAGPVTWSGLVDWTLYIFPPYLPLLVMPAALLHRGLRRRLESARDRAARIEVCGRNRDDRFDMPAEDFMFAEAQQNYVVVHFIDGDQTLKHMIRATLVELEAQIPNAVRVHRSYLVNPARALAVEGNARRRFLRLQGSEQPIPVSSRFDPELLRPVPEAGGGPSAHAGEGSAG